ncbi:MAG: bifunctional 4-hydroxy-3-methylbut-2-enyl diphosphate reductase/30S ribosomal protein S1 [Oscillospiraceae bacterium]|nr:bifunctional 4-hydroxy-3-methylbut-2-enyl diphosphate reductase/30S ribosomal protein S1 [Oscillospiraceae bacterium]
MNRRITVAKTAGFCFGVNRAVDMVYKAIDDGNKVVTLGPIIHNPDVVNDMKNKGVRVVTSVSDAKPDETVVIRSHGVPYSVINELETKRFEYIDATCPFVSRIHKIVREKSVEGFTILIAGDSSHPEIQGIVGNALNKPFVFNDFADLQEIFKKNDNFLQKKVAIIAQTTYNNTLWGKCIEFIENNCEQPQIYNTICNATSDRQAEAIKLASESDTMIVIGGKESSNTAKLCEICSEYCKCYHIENADELCGIDLSGSYSIGITAGASTPAYIIKEVQTLMSDNVKIMDEEFDFAKAVDESFKRIYTGNRVKGYITAVNDAEAIVDVGTKHTGYVPLSELTDNPALKPKDVVKVGDEVDLIVIKINDAEGIVTLSKKKVDAMVGFDKIVKAKENGDILTGVVISVVKGGVIVTSEGARIFVPASQATLRRDDKLEELVNKEVQFKIIEVNEQRGRAVGSIKEVAKAQKNEAQAKFWESVNVGDTFKGQVKSITDFGVFVDLGGIDGMVHRTELSWTRIKHPSDVCKVGDVLEVYIKELDKEKSRISLGYRKAEDNPWEIFKSKYNVDDVVKATIVSVTPFGAFAQIIPGIDGLIHISQIANQRVDKVADVLSVGQEVEAKITEIDAENQRISISMRALLPEEEVVETAEETPAEE